MATDFSTIVVEPMCTPLDIRLKHKRFTPAVISDAVLFDACIEARAMIEAMLNKYYTTDTLKGTPWASPFFSDSVWEDPNEDYDNVEKSLAADANERVGFRGITLPAANTNVFTQHYKLTFTSATTYDLEAFVEGAQGSATDLTSQFVSTNGDVTIEADADFGTFEKDHRFHFSVYSWYWHVVTIAKSLATAIAMANHYGLEASTKEVRESIEASTAKSFAKQAMTLLAMLNDPDGKKGIRLPSLGKRQLSIIAMPHDVSFLGQDLTKILSNNKDKEGNKGEQFGLFDVLVDEDDDFALWY